MKKIIFCFFSVLVLFAGCLGDNPNEPETTMMTDEEVIIEDYLNDLGLKPSDSEKIELIRHYSDSTTYKILAGMKNKNAWFSKFDPNGNEIYSYELKFNNTINGQTIYPQYINGSFLLIENDVLIVQSYMPEKKEGITLPYYSILSVIDFNTGKELHQFPLGKQSHSYVVNKEKYSYLIEETIHNYSSNRSVSKFYCFDFNLTPLWSRETEEAEKEGLEFYKRMAIDQTDIFIDENTLVSQFQQDRNGSTEIMYKIIDFKNYSLIFEKYVGDIPLFGDRVTEEGISYKYMATEIKNDFVWIIFGEYKRRKVVDSYDPIYGEKFHYEYDLLDKYYCEYDKATGNLVGKNKYN